MRILLTGSTGYIGGRLAALLLQQGHEIVCVARSPKKLDEREWASSPRCTVVEADVKDTEAIRHAAEHCDVAYYLVHSMESGTCDFTIRDRELAECFADALRKTSVERIIYLGGLGELGSGLSEHLRSRREVEQVLKTADRPVTAFRAAMIIGSGSASFEILRYLVERLPVMVTPKWVNTNCQPISIVDVLWYLSECLSIPATTGRTIEIGGPRVLSYRELMREMQEAVDLPKRLIVSLPVLTPKLSSLWIGLVTPVSPSIARPLAEGLRNEVVLTDDSAQQMMPRKTLGPAEAIRRALERINSREVPTRWTAAGAMPGDPDWAGGKVFVDARHVDIQASASSVFAAVCRVGGGHGWYAAGILWKIRGWMDQLIGGPGLTRGRRDPERVQYGEALDFWRVTDVKADERLALLAEMKLPGVAELAFEIDPMVSCNRLHMTAKFRPKGLLGLMYWLAVLPFHAFVFSGMLKGIKRAAIAIESGEAARPTAHTSSESRSSI